MFENEMLPDLTPKPGALVTPEDMEALLAQDHRELGVLNRRVDRLTFWFGFVLGNGSGAVMAMGFMVWFLSR